MTGYEIISVLIAALGFWIGYIEKRFANLKAIVDEKLTAQALLHKVIQDNFKEDIKRVEDKLDRIIELQLKSNDKRD